MTVDEIQKDRINNAHNNVFVKTFSDPENVKILLKMALPEAVKNAIDFSTTEIDFTTYVSDDVKDYYSDIVVKTRMKTKDGEEIQADIYILVEHKSTAKNKDLVQVLKYMYLGWQNDVDQGKPPRVIIPLIFYHGKEKWNVPRSFVDQFNVDDEIKKFLLNYRYILFDTRDWDFLDEANAELKNNVYLLTALVLMKSAYNEDIETIEAIFKLWHEKGFTEEKNKILFFLMYITEIRDMPLDKLQEKLKESKIEGGDLMPSLAQRLREEGERVGVKKGMKEGEKKRAKEAARQMLNDDLPIESIVKYTGLTEKEVKELLH
ncbi:MAG: Rpn family recombination-promoting nuclease/putative transposase [bacterium]|nr:Rpn family recombination-promoting nuclease/putative transposase [bacterium]